MQIKCGVIEKKINSTKHSFKTDSDFTIDAKLKEPCDEDNPVFLILNKNKDINYVKVPKWGYYWVTDIVHPTNELIELHCKKDVLATGIPYIKDCYIYTSYCSAHSIATEGYTMDDERLGPDYLYHTDKVPFDKTKPFDNPPPSVIYKYGASEPGEGTVLLSVIGLNAGVVTYALSPSEFVEVTKKVAEADVSTTDLLTSTFLGTSWKDACQSALYVPLKLGAFEELWSEPTKKILWGTVEIDMGRDIYYSGSPLAWASNEFFVDLPFHEDLRTVPEFAFLKGSKYTKVSFSGPTGTIDLSNDSFKYKDKIRCRETFSILDGTYTIKFFASTIGETPIAQYSCQLGWDFMKIMAYMPSTNEWAARLVTGAFKTLPKIAGGAMALGTVTAGYTMKDLAGVTSNMDSSQQATSLSTGITGAFSGSAEGAITRGGGSSAGIEGYFWKIKDELTGIEAWASKTTFCFKVETAIPAVVRDEKDPLHLSLAKLTNFHLTFGMPCNKMVRLSDHKETLGVYTYIQTVGTSIGMDWNASPVTTEWPLDLIELSELNNLLNNGVILEELDDKKDN